MSRQQRYGCGWGDLIYILIAEDEKDSAFMYTKLLEKRGHNITVTCDGQECLDVYHNKSSKIMREPANVNCDGLVQPFAVILDHKMLRPLTKELMMKRYLFDK